MSQYQQIIDAIKKLAEKAGDPAEAERIEQMIETYGEQRFSDGQFAESWSATGPSY